jgi:predicted TIM-barrel enzyme
MATAPATAPDGVIAAGCATGHPEDIRYIISRSQDARGTTF